MKSISKKTLPAILGVLAILVILIVQVGVLHAQAVSSWVFCANENGTCTFTGTRQVRYGVPGSYNYGTFTGSVACTNAVFGDPIVGTVKTCEYEALPAVSLNPPTHDFGIQEVGTSTTQSFTVTNSGDSALIIASVGIAGDPDFALSNDSCSGQTIAAGNSCTFDVTFAPAVLGSVSGIVSIESDAASSPDTVPVFGTGSDFTAPDGSIDTYPSDPDNSPSATFTFSATDNVTVAPNFTFWCTLLGGAQENCSSGSITYNSLPEGAHTFFLDVWDEAGQRDLLTYSWTVDLTAPVASIDSGPASPTKDTSATFTYSATDNHSAAQDLALYCELDGNSANCPPDTITYNGLSAGWHSFAFTAVDEAGNTDTRVYDWYVDLTPPDASIDSAPANPSRSHNATFTFSATDDYGAEKLAQIFEQIAPTAQNLAFWCGLDSGPWESCDSGTISYLGLTEGLHTFYLNVYDEVGNLTKLDYSWVIDFTPSYAPKSIWIAPDGLPDGVTGTYLYLTSITEFDFTMNGKAYQYTPPNHPWRLFAGGAYLLESANGFEEPIKICFYYPKANYSGKWYGKIYFLDDGNWVGLTTTQETLSGYGISPFLCTYATQPGIYIVADNWAPK